MTGHDVRIGPATPDDARAIAEIHVRTWQSAYRGILPDRALSSLAVADRFRLWQRLLGTVDAPVSTYVARAGARIVGFCSVGPPQDHTDQGPEISELFTLYVAPESQRQGIGKALLGRAEQAMEATGAFSGILWVLSNNEPAQAFYARNGWAADGIVKADVVLGVEIQESRFLKTFHEWSG